MTRPGNIFENIPGNGFTEVTGFIDTTRLVPTKQTYRTLCIDTVTNEVIPESVSTWVINDIIDADLMNQCLLSYNETYVPSSIIISTQIIARVYGGDVKLTRTEFNQQLSGKTIELSGRALNSYLFKNFNIDYHLNDTPDENALSSLSIKYGLTDIIKDPNVWQIPNYDSLYVTESIVKNSEGRQSL